MDALTVRAWALGDVVDALPMGVVLLDGQGIVILVNAAAKDILSANYEGQAWRDVIIKAFSPKVGDGHQVSLTNGRQVHVAISSLYPNPGQVVTLTDLTVSRHYDKAQEDSRRLADIGRMTAQLAHQIRTPLATARLYTDNLMTTLTTQPQTQKWLSRIDESLGSIERQLADLLLFVRGETLSKSYCSIKTWLDDTLKAFDVALKPIQLEIHMDKVVENSECYIHKESLSGALLNILNNAYEAGASIIHITLSLDGENKLLISITDNGEGMSQERQDKIFTPFYTTKARGTGLGLSVVKGVIAAHGGSVMLQSVKDQGTTLWLSITGVKVGVNAVGV